MCEDAQAEIEAERELKATRAFRAEKAQEENILRQQGGPRDGPRTRRLAQTLSPCAGEKNQARETQAHSGQATCR